MTLKVTFSHIIIFALSWINITTLFTVIFTFTIDSTGFCNHHTFNVILGVGQNVQQQGCTTYIDIYVPLNLVHGLTCASLSCKVNHIVCILQSLLKG